MGQGRLGSWLVTVWEREATTCRCLFDDRCGRGRESRPLYNGCVWPSGVFAQPLQALRVRSSVSVLYPVPPDPYRRPSCRRCELTKEPAGIGDRHAGVSSVRDGRFGATRSPDCRRGARRRKLLVLRPSAHPRSRNVAFDGRADGDAV